MVPATCHNIDGRTPMIVLDGILYGIGLVITGAVAAYFLHPLIGVPFYILAAFCLWFFRDPNRSAPAGDIAVSPADGKVVAVVKEASAQTRISIFLNIFDVHVNRSPIAGKVVDVQYQKGQFLVASKEEASAQNEQSVITVEDGRGSRVIFKQIAGLIARRIIYNVKIGDTIGLGDRIGLIKFGSRVDVLMGPEWDIDVRIGQRVQAGATILAHRRDDA